MGKLYLYLYLLKEVPLTWRYQNSIASDGTMKGCETARYHGVNASCTIVIRTRLSLLINGRYLYIARCCVIAVLVVLN